MSNSNEPINVANLQTLANQSMLNGALVIEMVNNSFSERKKNWSFDKARNVLAEKNMGRDMSSANYISTRFC